MEKTVYVCGFCFDLEKTKVVLIKKERPDWQKGKLNGVGGHVEKYDDDIYCAMEREFFEETGLNIDERNWAKFSIYIAVDYIVHFMKTFNSEIENVKTTTDEEIGVYSIPLLNSILNEETTLETIPNLKWLIPMALDNNILTAQIYNIYN